MQVLRAATWLHKWIALVVGLQILFWVGGGLVMTALPIERVRGEHHVRTVDPAPLPPGLRSLDAVRAATGLDPVKAELKPTPRGPAWVLTPVDGAATVVSAATGAPFPAMTPDEARRLAAGSYTGDGAPISARLLAQAPAETGKDGPLWRVDFDDAERTTFYLSPDSGEVVSRRSGVWRFYDFFWRLHIMNFGDGENFNHPLLIFTTVLAFTVVLSGFVLLWIRLARDWARSRRRG